MWNGVREFTFSSSKWNDSNLLASWLLWPHFQHIFRYGHTIDQSKWNNSYQLWIQEYDLNYFRSPRQLNHKQAIDYIRTESSCCHMFDRFCLEKLIENNIATSNKWANTCTKWSKLQYFGSIGQKTVFIAWISLSLWIRFI